MPAKQAEQRSEFSKKHRPRALLGAAAMTLAGALLSTPALANDRAVGHRFTEYADVIDVRPVYRDVQVREPRRECWIEEQRHVIRHEGQAYPNRSRRTHSGGDALVGGLIGGVIGNQLGRNGSSGARAGATVAGAIIGSVIANESHASDGRHRRHNNHSSRQRVYRQPTVETRPVEHCRRVIDTRIEQRANGYDVTYRYRGSTFTTRMNRDPGDRIELQVNVRPARQ